VETNAGLIAKSASKPYGHEKDEGRISYAGGEN